VGVATPHGFGDGGDLVYKKRQLKLLTPPYEEIVA